MFNGFFPVNQDPRTIIRGDFEDVVTRFWYIRFVDPMKLLMTGMTRDGLFWIENGQICYGVKNLRFNESPLHVLANIEMMGQPRRTGGSAYVPPLKVRNFTFTSGTSF